MEKTFSRILVGNDMSKDHERVWLPGTPSEVVASMKKAGLEVIMDRPSRAADKVVKEPKAKKAKKVSKSKKTTPTAEPVAA